MRILITSGLSARDTGGPAQYGPNLANEFKKLGHEVDVVCYEFEKKLPVGIRHLWFFERIISKVWNADLVFALDTFSVGVPSVAAAALLGKRSIVRVGGDFLWESYIARTKEKLPLPAFYESHPVFNLKERIIFACTKFLANSSILAFNTEWQRGIWKEPYALDMTRTKVVKNFIPPRREGAEPNEKNFLWAGRKITLKNLDLLGRAMEKVRTKYPDVKLEIVTKLSREALEAKMRACYAVVLPSLSDVCPNVILEGASFGKPFIMTTHTGIHEICPDGGIFVDPLSQREMEEAIEKMLDPEAYAEFKRKLSNMEIHRAWSDLAHEYLSIIG
ncbi:MAG: glucosyltransferase [Parcubacteria group bacterium]|nr:glucosyltransferase [Parcubacteria group bacterium]